MMKRNHTRLCASAAIAAALALSSTPLLAQPAPAPTTVEPAPVPVFPETLAVPPAQPATVQPTIVVPDIEAAPAPVVETPAEPAPTTTTRTERAATPDRTRVAAPADPEPAAVEPDVAPVATDIVPEPVAEPVAPIAATEPVETSAPVDNDNSVQFGIAVIAAIAAIVLAIWGFVAIGRRRPVDRKAAAIIERPAITPPAPEPVATVAPVAAVTPLATARPAAPSLSHSGAAVPLPRTMPASFAERDALIKKMIAAKPDRANPFNSYAQRAKRAKLILQSLGTDFSDRDPWIDLSQYTANWPELAGRKHAAA